MENLYKSYGTLKYSIGKEKNAPRLILEIDKDISRYYRSFIPKSILYNIPKYPPHITVVREGKEQPLKLEEWGKYEGEEIEFQYDNIIKFGSVYIWINCFSKRLEEIRLGLGMEINSLYTLPPEGFVKCFHSTIANIK